MFTNEMTHVGLSLDALEEASDWEEAAQILDLEAGLTSSLRKPEIEFNARPSSLAGAFLLYLAATHVGGDVLADFMVGSETSAAAVAAHALELQLQMALAGREENAAAIGMRISSSNATEREIWQMSCGAAPMVSRLLGNARLLPADVPAAACANWMSRVAEPFGARLSAPSISPAEYVCQLHVLLAKSVLEATALGLEERGKKMRGATATVVGNGPIARECLRSMHEIGVRVVAIADESGALIDSGGIAVLPLLRHFESGGLLAEYGDAQHALRSEALAVSANVLLLETPGDEMTAHIAKSIHAELVVEAASGGLSSTAVRGLGADDVLVIPARLVRCVRTVPELLPSGKVKLWSEERQSKLRSRMQCLWEEIAVSRKQRQLSMPMAVLVLAMQRLAEREQAARP